MVKTVGRIASVLASGAAVCLVAGCGSKQNDSEIIIGVVTAQTGALASYDQPSLAGLRMAIDEINARGGLGGRYPAKLMVRDTRSDTAATAAAAQEVVDAGAKIMITPCDADPSIGHD